MPSLKTVVVRVDASNPEKPAIAQAAGVVRRGGLVAFPTETVYGLGADAFNPEAVHKVFRAKGRAVGNPLIVLIAHSHHLKVLTRDIPAPAEILMGRFWPGPLTLILKGSARVPAAVTGGEDSVAVRMPGSKLALELITACGSPVVGPSANLSGRPSATTGEHVLHDLRGRIDMLLDAGPVGAGIESTVLDISTSPPRIVRLGAVSVEKLRESAGEAAIEEGQSLPGYGQGDLKAEFLLVTAKDRVEELVERYAGRGKKVGLLSHSPHLYGSAGQVAIKAMPQEPAAYARRLFAALRELDEEGVDVVLVEEVEETGVGMAIMDRLRRLAGTS
jgi:L-threonylcarbamoyladenylate synthase